MTENVDGVTYQRLGERRDGKPIPGEWNANYSFKRRLLTELPGEPAMVTAHGVRDNPGWA